MTIVTRSRTKDDRANMMTRFYMSLRSSYSWVTTSEKRQDTTTGVSNSGALHERQQRYPCTTASVNLFKLTAYDYFWRIKYFFRWLREHTLLTKYFLNLWMLKSIQYSLSCTCRPETRSRISLTRIVQVGLCLKLGIHLTNVCVR